MKSLTMALLVGVLVTLSLFWLMQVMLMSNTQQVRKDASLTMMEFIRLKKEPPKPKKKEPEKQVQQIEKKQQPTPKKEQPTPPKPKKIQQPTPVKQQTAPVDSPKLDLPLPMPSVPTSGPKVSIAASGVVGDSKPSASNSEAEHGAASTNNTGKVVSGVVPLERVEPKYPQRAASRHLEGWVKVEFTISTDGEVSDAEVIAAEPADIFDQATLKAIRQWKFKGKIVDGVAVEQRAEQTFRFKLAE